MSRSPGSPVNAIAPTAALADQSFRAIRDAITSGRLVAGQPVTERSLAQFLNVSPTPVREALRQLEQEGLIERSGRVRRVAALAEGAHAEMVLIHAALRGVSARIAAEKATDADIECMRRSLADAAAARASDQVGSSGAGYRAFHAIIESLAQGQILQSFLSTTEAFDEAYKVAALTAQRAIDPSGLRKRVNQHRAILKAIEAHDGGLAESLMREHTLEVSRSYLAFAGRPKPRALP
jgi:DNA-binding GntR family transcriptional regulator